MATFEQTVNRWYDAIGVVLYYVALNLRQCFVPRASRRFYTYSQLWSGRESGSAHDGRPYAMVGVLCILLLGLCILYGIF